jgi:hypothetical protein
MVEPKECLTVGHIKITPIVRGGFWLQRDDGFTKEILPGVLEAFLAKQLHKEET